MNSFVTWDIRKAKELVYIVEAIDKSERKFFTTLTKQIRDYYGVVGDRYQPLMMYAGCSGYMQHSLYIS